MRKVVSLLLLGALAGAQDPEELEEFAKQFERIVEAGGLKMLLDQMPEDAAEHPFVLRRMAVACAKSAEARAASDPETWQRLVKLLETGCKALPEEMDTEETLAARAETLYCKARVDAALGEPFDRATWTGAADGFLALHRKAPDGGKHLERAARILAEGAAGGGDSAADLRTRADELCLEGGKKFKSNAFFVQARHRAQLGLIERTAKKSRPQASKMLKAYLESLTKSDGSMSVKDLKSAYNDAVSFARTHKKLGLKPLYKTERVKISLVSLEIPISNRWKKKGSTIYQYDQFGKLMRTFNVRTFKWTTNYYLGQQMFGGDNIKGLARIGETDVLSVIIDVKRRRKLRRGRLSRAIPSAQMFEIGGYTDENKYLCYRWYYFKAKKTKLRSVKIGVLDTGEYKKLDPAAAHVLSTIRE